jgi:hypothetical protein
MFYRYANEMSLCRRRMEVLLELSKRFHSSALENANTAWLLSEAGDLAIEYRDVISAEAFADSLAKASKR